MPATHAAHTATAVHVAHDMATHNSAQSSSHSLSVNVGMDGVSSHGACGHVGANIPVGGQLAVSGGLQGCIGNPLSNAPLTNQIGVYAGVTIFF
jgi:hypothetical protein